MPRPHGAPCTRPALHAARPLPRPALGPVSARTAPTLAASAQISSILADQTGIERLKHDYVAPQRSSMQNLSETFGKPFSLLWLLPTAVKFHGLTYRDLLAEEMMADMECSPCV